MSYSPFGSGDGLTASSGTITSSANNQIISGYDLTGNIVVNHTGVIVRGCRISHNGGNGIEINANDCVVAGCEINNTAAPSTGQNSSSSQYSIEATSVSNVTVLNSTLRNASTGIRLQSVTGALLVGIEGYNFRGPLPRGQLMQADTCTGVVLMDFRCFNDPNIAAPEDNINLYESSGCRILNGTIDGNNSTSGVGVMIENLGADDNVVQDVDCLRYANGAFFAYDSADNNTFNRCRARDQIPVDQGNGKPSSRNYNSTTRARVAPATIASGNSATNTHFTSCTHTDTPGYSSYVGPLTESNETWTSNFTAGTSPTTNQWTEASFVDRPLWKNVFPWTAADSTAPTITSSNTLSLANNTALWHTLTANESVTWSLVGGADQSLFKLAGAMLWLGPKSLSTPTDADSNGSYVVQVRATDLSGNTTDQTITVTVAVSQPVKVQSKINTTSSGSTSNTVTLDATATAGNLLLALVAVDKTSGAFTTPSGWTLLSGSTHTTGDGANGAIYWKQAAGGETGATFAWTTSNLSTCQIIEYSNVSFSGGTPFDGTAFDLDGLNTRASVTVGPTASTTVSKALALAAFANDSSGSLWNVTRSYTNSFVEQAALTESGNHSAPCLLVATLGLNSSGATPSTTMSHSGTADETVGWLVVIKGA